MKSTKVLMMLAVAVFGAAVSRPAQGAIVVGSCVAGSQYSTIQGAVDAAPSGAVIKVCPSGYPEQVVIEKPLTLEGFISSGTEGAFILPPVGGLVANQFAAAPQILVRNTTNVTISNLIVDGASRANCGLVNIGIFFYNASGTVNRVAVHNQTGPAGVACTAYGIEADVDTSGVTATLTVQNSDFRNQQIYAVYAFGTGLTVNTLNNYIAGPDNSAGEPAGIVYYQNAMGTIQGNTVVNEVTSSVQFGHPLVGGIGISVLCASATVAGNVVTNTQTGVVLACPYDGAYPINSTVSGNKIFETCGLGDGIYVSGPGSTITKNTIVGSAQSGIHFDGTYGGDANGNTASANTITEACTGILTTGAATNAISTTTFNAVDVPTLNGASCGPLF